MSAKRTPSSSAVSLYWTGTIWEGTMGTVFQDQVLPKAEWGASLTLLLIFLGLFPILSPVWRTLEKKRNLHPGKWTNLHMQAAAVVVPHWNTDKVSATLGVLGLALALSNTTLNQRTTLGTGQGNITTLMGQSSGKASWLCSWATHRTR